MNGPAPMAVPQTIQRSWRSAVVDRARRSARAEEGEPGEHVGGDVERLEAVEPGDGADQPRRILGGAQQHRRAEGADGNRRHVEERPAAMREPGQRARARPLGEDQAEMDEQRRQEQRRDLVGPVEHPVDAVEAAREREREHAEERDRQPEEMQRRLVAGAPRAHGGADQQRKDADGGEHVVEAAHAARDRRQGHLGDTAIAERQQRVGVAGAAGGLLLQRVHVVAGLDGLAVDREQHVAGADAGAGRRRDRVDLGGDDARRSLHPEHAVFHVVARRPLNDVGQAEQEQQRGHADRQRRAQAVPPFGGGFSRAASGTGGIEGTEVSAGAKHIPRSEKSESMEGLCFQLFSV